MLTEDEQAAIRRHYRTLADSLPHFRPRAAQREMIAAVARAFSRSKSGNNVQREGESIIAVEAPTGVGKSLAYLLAGGIMAQSRGKKLIVSSATVALQEQLVLRDLPLLTEKGGLPLTFTLAKGRGRYLCPYKLYQITQHQLQQGLDGFEPPAFLLDRRPDRAERERLQQMSDDFAARRFNGDRDQWPHPFDEALWAQIASNPHDCLKNACPNRTECPFFIARDGLDQADVIVANHDLLMVDVAMGGGVILPAPEDSFYCLDEAHHLPKKALSRFAAEHSWQTAVRTLEKLPAHTGQAAALTGKDETADRADEAAAALLDSLREWPPLLHEYEDAFARSSDTESVWLWENGRLPEGTDVLAENCRITAQSLLKHLDALRAALAAARRDSPPHETAMLDRTAADLGVFAARAEQIAAVWTLMAQTPPDDAPPLAKWIVCRRDGNKNDWTFHASPVSSAAQLADGLWRKAAGVLLTSATLRGAGDFDLLLRQSGLAWLPETQTLALDSPFDFAAQGELYLPRLRANPKDADAHTAEVAEWLPKLIDPEAAVGTLVLFASRKQMREVALRLPESHLPLLLVQGEQSKQSLLAQHHAAIESGKASILFGLDSFAEGLDLPGAACVQVVIAKLPFTVPDDPVGKTLNDWIKRRGGNPFLEISVPEAGVKLVQAAGRLIRSESDYGRVTILDTRIFTRDYGRRLLAALPPFKRVG